MVTAPRKRMLCWIRPGSPLWFYGIAHRRARFMLSRFHGRPSRRAKCFFPSQFMLIWKRPDSQTVTALEFRASCKMVCINKFNLLSQTFSHDTIGPVAVGWWRRRKCLVTAKSCPLVGCCVTSVRLALFLITLHKIKLIKCIKFS